MADDEEFYIDGRAINELRVVDLKKECDKRELSKSGSKNQLIERLKAQLLLEKLQKLPVDQDAEAPNLKLQEDEVAGSNEFIKQYLRRQKELLKLQREESSQESDYSQEESPQKGSFTPKPPVKDTEKEQDYQEEESQRENSEKAEESRNTEEAVNMGTRRKWSSRSTEETGNQENTEPVSKGRSTRTRSRRESEREAEDASPMKEVAQKPGEESNKGDERVLEERNGQEKEDNDAEGQDTKTEESKREVIKEWKAGEGAAMKSEGKEGMALSSSRDQTKKKYAEKDVKDKDNGTQMETEDGFEQHTKAKSEKKGDKKSEKQRSRSSSSSSRSRSESRSSSRSSSESPPRSKLKGRVERKQPMSSSRDRSESPPKSKLKGKVEQRRSWSSSRSSSESPQKFKGQAQKRRSRSDSESNSPSPEKKKAKPARRRSSSSSSSSSRSRSKKSRSRSAESRSDSSRSRSRSRSRSHSRSPKLRSLPISRLKSPPIETAVHDESSFHTAPEDTPVKNQMCSPEKSSKMETDTGEKKGRQSDIPLPAPEKEEGELPQESEPKEQKKSARRISLTRGDKDGEKEEDKEHSQQTEGSGEKPLRKRKWGSKTATTANKPPRKATSMAISTVSLKGLISDIKPSMLIETALDLDGKDEGGLSDQEDTRDVKIQRTVIQVVKQEVGEESSSDEEEKDDEEEEGEEDTEEEEEEEAKDKTVKVKTIGVDKKDGEERHDVDKENKKKKTFEERVKGEPKIIRRVSNPPLVQPDEPMKAGRGQSPARNPVSRILHIRNLVRPFTLNQLKELMKRTGNFTDEGFWIDKIKSHCYVTYSTEEEAMATRKALHGTRWPQSNPKILSVDYGTEDEVHHHRNLEIPQAPIQKEKPVPRKEKEKERVKEKERERDRKKKEEKKEEVKPIREWDRDKLRQSEERERERRRARSLSRERRQHERSRERERAKKEKKAPVLEKKVEDEPPAKLLDDLFRKTKATPCIYWLPLTEAQIAEREAARKQRETERQKRREEQEKIEEAERKQRVADRAKRRETEERSRSQKDKETLEVSPVKERGRNRRQGDDGSRKRLERSRSSKSQSQSQSHSREGRRR